MVIGVVTVDLTIPGSTSLKEKRMVLRSLKERLRNNFNVSIAELDDHDKWQKAVLGLASIGSEKKYVNGTLDKALDLIKEFRRAELVDYQLELL